MLRTSVLAALFCDCELFELRMRRFRGSGIFSYDAKPPPLGLPTLFFFSLITVVGAVLVVVEPTPWLVVDEIAAFSPP